MKILQLSLLVLSCLGVASMLAIGWIYYPRSQRRRIVGKVSKLIIYPVKSCAGIEVDEAVCTPYGLMWPSTKLIKDRQFMVTDSDNNFLTARACPTLLLVKPSLVGYDLVLNAPDMPTLKIDLRTLEALTTRTKVVFNYLAAPHDTCYGMECGDETHEWLTRFLKVPARLIFLDPDLGDERRMPIIKPGAFNRPHRSLPEQNKIMYADKYPILAVNLASCVDLNSKLPDLTSHVTYKNFRPNIVMDSPEAYAEDSWRCMTIGSQEFFNEAPCSRCRLVNVNPVTGLVHAKAEPLNSLRKFRILKDYNIKSPSFGIYLTLEGDLTRLRVGDDIITH